MCTVLSGAASQERKISGLVESTAAGGSETKRDSRTVNIDAELAEVKGLSEQDLASEMCASSSVPATFKIPSSTEDSEESASGGAAASSVGGRVRCMLLGGFRV